MNIVKKGKAKKMDKRKKYYLIVDVETAGGFDNPLVYDIGGAIIDKKGNIYESFSYVIYDIYVNEKGEMANAYYADKLPLYEQYLKIGYSKMVKFTTARFKILELMKKYNAYTIVAHNVRFDYKALNNTFKHVTKGTKRYFFPKKVNFICTMRAAQQTIAKQKSYISWVNEHGFVTKHKTPRPQVTAEVLYRYMTSNLGYIEEHTGFEDVLIEKEIFAWILRQNKKIEKYDPRFRRKKKKKAEEKAEKEEGG